MKKLLMIISLILVLSTVFALTSFAQGENVTADNEIKNPVKITFDSQGGSAVAPIIVESGSKIVPPQAPTREYYKFVGWYVVYGENNEFQEEWSFVGYVATEDMTLVARWEESGEMPPMEFKVNGSNFLTSLGYMGKGMVGIFVVTLVIIGVVAILNWHGRSLEKRNQNKED